MRSTLLIFFVFKFCCTIYAWDIMFGDRHPADRILNLHYEAAKTTISAPTNLSVTFNYCGFGQRNISLIKLDVDVVSALMQ